MVLVSINVTNEHEGDLRTCDRILRGIQGLTNSGYIVERYDHFTERQDKHKKMILAVTRTSEANDAEFEAWLNELSKGGTSYMEE